MLYWVCGTQIPRFSTFAFEVHVRFLRAFALFAIFIAVYLAQYISDHRSLVDFFPQWFLNTFPGMYRFTRWLPEDLLTLAVVIATFGSIGFGLLSTQWIGEYLIPEVRQRKRQHHTRYRSYWLGTAAVVVAASMAGFVSVQMGSGAPEQRLLHIFWLTSLVLYVGGAILLERTFRTPSGQSAEPSSSARALVAHPEGGWPYLVLILLLAGVLMSWQLTELPARVDPIVAQNGLQSLALAQGAETRLFHPGATGLPLLAYIPTAAALRLLNDVLVSDVLLNDVLVSARLVGVAAGLLTVAATWLLGCELFRRTQRVASHRVVLEDDGRWIALLAALVVATSHIAIHFSHVSIYLLPAALGTLGLWAMMRGARTESRLFLACSGMLIGLASLGHPSGLLYLVVTPIWWIGIWLLRRRWLYSETRGVGGLGFSIWLGGILVVLLPVVSIWLAEPGAFVGFLQSYVPVTDVSQTRLEALFLSSGFESIFWENLRRTFLTFTSLPNASALLNYPGAFLHNALAPLFILAIGGLLLNLDRLPGWLLLSFLGTGLIMNTMTAQTPVWVRLLPLLPLAGLFIGFTLDRARLTLLETVGTWTDQTTVYLAVGIIAWAGLHSWVTYYNFGMRNGDAASNAGRAAREVPAEQVPLLLLTEETSIRWSDPTVQYFTSSLAGQRQGGQVSVTEWPTELPGNSQLLIQPADVPWLDEIRNRYPGGTVTVRRDLRSDPVMYIYSLAQ